MCWTCGSMLSVCLPCSVDRTHSASRGGVNGGGAMAAIGVLIVPDP